ncbi:condensation domain-containing protein [Dactylosporangium sp. NBC_01737]|uniref:condensation domain-containing protein n=1 Tax=Dactylosporangium sp. NBC_01737 TaxID=2975959 RepID=UPI002E0F3901|nr:condensation domain-containing protein [Dactylosporangium sp. NBC_01737]
MPDTYLPAPADTTGIRATTRIPVRFSGDGAGIGPLSWGQREIWLTMLRQRSWLPIGGWAPLPAGTAIEDVVADLQWAMHRYPTFRTRLRFDAGGEPLQTVAAQGTIGLDVFDVPPGADPEAYTAAVDAHYRAQSYDFVADWPVRMGVVRVGGSPAYLSTVTCHLVTDGVGGRLMLREVAARAEAAPTTGLQPLDQVRWQASPDGLKQRERALKHWDRMLRQLPPAGPLAERPGPRHHRGEFRSAALYTATHTVSTIADLDTSQVLMTFLAIALTDQAGDGRPAVIRPMVDNRFRRGLGDVVAMVAQHGICVADVAGRPFADALRQTGIAAMLAYKWAYHDPAAVQAHARTLAGTLGIDLDAGIWFNDRRTISRQMFPGDAPTAEQVHAAAPGEFRWTAAQDDPYDPLNIDVDDEPGHFLLTWFTDTWRNPPARVEALARSVEAIAVHQALQALSTAAETRTP